MKYLQLDELAELINGSTPLKSNKKYWNKGTINWFTAEDLRNGNEVSSTKKFVTKFALDNTSIKLVPKDSVLLCCTASIGLIGINKIELTTNQQFNAIVPNKELINFKYLYYFLKSYMSEFEKKASTTTVGFISQKKVKSISVPVPSLQEQEKIVEKLDKLFENIDNYKLEIDKTINNSRKLFISILDKVYSPLSQEDLQLKKLSDISEIKGGKRVPKGYKLLDKKTNFPYIRVSDFDSNGGIDESNLKFIDENIYNQIQKYTINSNDLFISIAGTIGKSGMIPSKLNGANLTENACKLVFNESAHNRFIYFFTKSNFFNKQVLEKTKTAGQPKLAISRLGEILVQIPTLEKQIELTKKFDEIEAKLNSLINNKNNLIYKTKLLKKSILNKEFSYE